MDNSIFLDKAEQQGSAVNVKKIPLRNTEEGKTALRNEIVSFMKDHDFSQHDVAKKCELPVPYVNQVLGTGAKAVSFAKLCDMASQIGMKLTLLVETNRK